MRLQARFAGGERCALSIGRTIRAGCVIGRAKRSRPGRWLRGSGSRAEGEAFVSLPSRPAQAAPVSSGPVPPRGPDALLGVDPIEAKVGQRSSSRRRQDRTSGAGRGRRRGTIPSSFFPKPPDAVAFSWDKKANIGQRCQIRLLRGLARPGRSMRLVPAPRRTSAYGRSPTSGCRRRTWPTWSASCDHRDASHDALTHLANVVASSIVTVSMVIITESGWC